MRKTKKMAAERWCWVVTKRGEVIRVTTSEEIANAEYNRTPGAKIERVRYGGEK